MEFKEGYAYHIKDDYFSKVNDDKLMQNKENGNYRPTYFCMRDNKNPYLLWVVPMSTQIGKYDAIQKKQIEKYGKCLTIVIGEFDGKTNAFLLQNMFPVTPEYLSHVHTRNDNPVPVGHSLRKEIETNMKQIKVLVSRGRKVVFPDISRLEQLMLAELEQEKTSVITAESVSNPEKQPMLEKIKTSTAQAKENNANREKSDHHAKNKTEEIA